MFGGSAGRSAWLAGILSLGCMTSHLDDLSSGEGHRPHPRDAGVDSNVGAGNGAGGEGAGGASSGSGAASNGGNDGTGASTSTSGGASSTDGGPPGGGDPCTEEGAHECA